MSFLDTVRRAKTYLEEQGRVSLSALKLEFDLDDARLESLIEELVDGQQIAAREGKVLSWIGAARAEASAPEPKTRATPVSRAYRVAPSDLAIGNLNNGEKFRIFDRYTPKVA